MKDYKVARRLLTFSPCIRFLQGIIGSKGGWAECGLYALIGIPIYR
jgi:hypothetical protein